MPQSNNYQNQRGTNERNSTPRANLQPVQQQRLINLCCEHSYTLIEMRQPMNRATKHLLKCSCGCEFETNIVNLTRSTHLCPECRRFFQRNQARVGELPRSTRVSGFQRRGREGRRNIARQNETTPSTINTVAEMAQHLRDNPSPYNNYILELFTRPNACHST